MNKYIIIGLGVLLLLVFSITIINSLHDSHEDQSIPQQDITTTPIPSPSITETVDTNVVDVTITTDAYSPKTITISPGTTVRWTNRTGTDASVHSDPHIDHSSYDPLNLPSFADGQTHTQIFPDPGTYTYHDHLYPTRTGTVIVQ